MVVRRIWALCDLNLVEFPGSPSGATGTPRRGRAAASPTPARGISDFNTEGSRPRHECRSFFVAESSDAA